MDDCFVIFPTQEEMDKCLELLNEQSEFNTVLSHVQKVHLKMAAFQCRICKHYRTTHERIQSHVTTVHKARSNKFDSSLAGPISASDMQLMERMISICFPGVRVKLEITDRLCIRTFEYNGVKT
uniref:C2H2-type domain-containing protein n=1 Tax=Angiostrongylus cantonensis TaxID=6313 RepID=A0A0K0D0E5_ANGCA